jgi:hypothetical protein
MRNGIQCIIPAWLEELVPINLSETAMRLGANVLDKTMGWPCARGQVITEMEAFRLLSGIEALPIAGARADAKFSYLRVPIRMQQPLMSE